VSYRAGGIGRSYPRIVCDGCGAELAIMDEAQPRWLELGKPAPGWGGGRKATGYREDFCPECKTARKWKPMRTEARRRGR